MKKILYFAAIFALAALTVFTASRHDAKSFSERRPVGKLTIYTSMYEDVVTSLDTCLKKQFPECKIKFFYGKNNQIQARIAVEQDAGKLGCDIVLAAEPSYSLELKEKGLLHRYISVEAGNLAFGYDKDGCWYPVIYRFVDGTVIIPSTIMMIAGKWSANNNTKAAEILTDWFLGPQGQKILAVGSLHSVRSPPAGR